MAQHTLTRSEMSVACVFGMNARTSNSAVLVLLDNRVPMVTVI
eukprot:COSAG02_NODE_2234_length_9423_cov_7.200343_6_plen_43_part_00